MRVMFVEVRKKLQEEDKLRIKKAIYEFIKKYPKIQRVGILASLQYINSMPFLKQELEKGGVKVFTSKGNIARYPSQVLGCDVLAARNIEKYVDAFILLSDGRFHALQLATNKPIFILDENFVRIDKEEIEYMRRKRLAAIKKFLASDKIGIIVSTKPGQERLKEALKIKNILERKRKKVFVFVADTINPAELENFQCHAWLNMACPALVLDSSEIVNWQDVKKFLR